MQNSNQQDLHYPKRECISFSKHKIFTDFEENQNKIIQEYDKSSKALIMESIRIITHKLLGNNSQGIFKPKALNMIEQEDPLYELHQKISRQIMNEGKNNEQSMRKKNQIQYIKKSPQRPSKGAKNHNKLLNQLSRLSMDEKFTDQNESTNERDTNQTNLLKFDEALLKNKTITELLQESNAKTLNNRVLDPIMESDGSEGYQMTDYSSNQSSNDDKNYDQIYMYEDQMKPLFGNLFLNKSQSQESNNQSKYEFQSKSHFPENAKKLNFKHKNLLESPKKDKQQRKKRLYIREKKIPRWAEDFNQISKVVQKQRHQINPKEIYGNLLVENLQTNVIFNIKEDYKRTSSAKWLKNKNGYIY